MLAIWVGFALVTIVSGITGVVFEFHDDSIVSREVFGGIPSALRLAFYVVTPLLIVCRGSALLAAGAQLGAGRARPPRDHAQERRTAPARLPRRRLHADAAARPRRRRHALAASTSASSSCSAVTTVLEIDHQMPESAKFLHGGVYQGVLARRRRRRARVPRRHRLGDRAAATCSGRTASASRPSPSTRVILGVFFVLGVTGFVDRGVPHRARRTTRRSRSGRSSATRSSALVDRHRSRRSTRLAPGAVVRRTWPRSSCSSSILPITMLRHMFTSPLNMYLRDRDRPKGAMKPMPNLMETELETFGASTVEDFTWKQLLDTDACTMCGRCTSVCPAHATGKPLDPREIVLKTGEVMAATGHAGRVAADRRRCPRSPSRPTRCSSASRPRRSGRARRARRATRSARSTSRSSTRSSTCGATCR